MNLNNPYIKLSIFTTVYLIVLIFIAPAIDHFFTTLEEDINKKESNIQILGEVIIHIIVLAILWYLLNKYLSKYLEKLLKVKIKEQTLTAIEIVTALALLGLQKNLINKLEYITIKHPFRLLN
mgnify:CR=1 FL=1|tara:strand:- start:5874 stop:6242 length:369 start_codon:yes stop_codon:yes gene_type:complete